ARGLPADRPVEARRPEAGAGWPGGAAMKHIAPPHIDYKGLAPLFAVTGGSLVVIMVSLLRSRWVHRVLIPALPVIALGAAIGLSIWNWSRARRSRSSRAHWPSTPCRWGSRSSATSLGSRRCS